MKHFFISVLFFSTTIYTTFAQNGYDNNWVFAGVNQSMLLNFDNDSLHISLIPGTDYSTPEANINMSDAAGNLIFYSNMCSVTNAVYETMDNGEGLNPGEIQQFFCTANPGSFTNSQSMISIPTPGSNHTYDIYHENAELFNYWGPGESYSATSRLLRTRIDMSQNNGLGKVIEKNIPILEDTLRDGKLTAIKHANGRDWWLIVPEYHSNCYYKVLIDPGGVHIEKQCIGPVWPNLFKAVIGAKFTPDGSKYMLLRPDNMLNIFDFDRCSGTFSNPKIIALATADSANLYDLSVSGSGRFIYVNTIKKIYQFDLETQDIAASKTLVATNNTSSPLNNDYFYTSQRGPDGKIYICSGANSYDIHTINHPDSAGLACEVLQYNIQLPDLHYGWMPNIVNYRLGALPGACDTIVVSVKDVTEKDNDLRVYPNPGSGDLHISLSGEKELNSIALFDIAGRLIYRGNCTGSEFFLSREAYYPEKGFYLLTAEDQNGRKYLRKLVIE